MPRIPKASPEATLWNYAHHELSTVVPKSRSFAVSAKRAQAWATTICSLTSENPGPVVLIAFIELEDRIFQKLAKVYWPRYMRDASEPGTTCPT